jgi:hypothetical protein
MQVSINNLSPFPLNVNPQSDDKYACLSMLYHAFEAQRVDIKFDRITQSWCWRAPGNAEYSPTYPRLACKIENIPRIAVTCQDASPRLDVYIVSNLL